MMMHYLKYGRSTEVIYAGITEGSGTNFVPLEEF